MSPSEQPPPERPYLDRLLVALFQFRKLEIKLLAALAFPVGVAVYCLSTLVPPDSQWHVFLLPSVPELDDAVPDWLGPLANGRSSGIGLMFYFWGMGLLTLLPLLMLWRLLTLPFRRI